MLRKRNLELIPSAPSSRNKDNSGDNNLWAKPVKEVSIKESNSFRSPTRSEFCGNRGVCHFQGNVSLQL